MTRTPNAGDGAIVVHPVPTADGGYYVWVAAGGRGAARSRDEALRLGHDHLVAVRAQERRLGDTFWDRVAQAHRWVRRAR